jgi:hypothetical protein
MKVDHGNLIEALRDRISELASEGVDYTASDIIAIFDRASVQALVQLHRDGGAVEPTKRPTTRKPRQRKARRALGAGISDADASAVVGE